MVNKRREYLTSLRYAPWGVPEIIAVYAVGLALISFSACAPITRFPVEDGLIVYSRTHTVRVKAQSRNSLGSGFFLDASHVLTCFHVVGGVRSEEGKVFAEFAPDILVITEDGESYSGTLLSVPSASDPSPIEHDFAIIRLARPAKGVTRAAQLMRDAYRPQVGEPIVFSGFPLDVPTMITHQGFVSGVSKDGRLIVLQAPINKGNSGSAVLNRSGVIIGLINAREGGLTRELESQRQLMEEVVVYVSGFDVSKTTAHLIDTLDKYISPGIGYAVNIGSVAQWIRRHVNDLGK